MQPSSDVPKPVGGGAKRSIAARLFAGALVWSVVVLVGGALLLSALYRTQLLTLLEAELDSTIVELSRALDNVEVEVGGELIRDGRVATVDDMLPRDSRFGVPLSGQYWAVLAVNEAGEVTGDARSQSVWDAELPAPPELLARAIRETGVTVYGSTIGPGDEQVRVAMRGVRFENRATPVILLVAADQEAAIAGAQQFLALLVGAMVVLAGGVLAAMVAQIRYGLAPLKAVQQHIADVREGRRSQLDTDYPREVQPLTEELNKLLEHNREVVSRAQTHVGNLAHALKTPIAVMMNEARGDGPLDALVRRQVAAMSDNVQHYLKRAQAAARAEVMGARTDIEPVVADLRRLLVRLFADKGVEISTSLDPAAIFRGERQDLEEMMGNLMENACKWADAQVRVTSALANGTVLVRVEDDGPGLTPDQREIALKRGGRLDERTPGTGLGLSIVAELVDLHRGTLELGTSALGGLSVEMRFPAP